MDEFRARDHQVIARRSRKGARNDLVLHPRGRARVIGATDLSGLRPGILSPARESALSVALGALERTRFGAPALDLLAIERAIFGDLVEPPIGSESVAWHQVIDATRADQGADLSDLLACCAHRDDLTSWADAREVRRVFRVDEHEPDALAWPLRVRVARGVLRSSERVAPGILAGPVIGADGHPFAPDDERARSAPRVFIGHRLRKRGALARVNVKRAQRTREAFVITRVDQIAPMVETIGAGERVTFRAGTWSGSITRSRRDARFSMTASTIGAPALRPRSVSAARIVSLLDEHVNLTNLST